MRRHAAGEKFRPSASEANAWSEAADFYRTLKGKQNPFASRMWQPGGGVIWVQNTGEVDIPRYGFGIILEPVFTPDDDVTLNEFQHRPVFKVRAPDGSEEWRQYFTKYRRPCILLRDAPADLTELVPAVASGLCVCKLAYTEGAAGDANETPTAAYPTSASSATAAGGGPLKIVALAEDDFDGGRWALVDVAGDFKPSTYIKGTLSADVAKGAEETVVLSIPFGVVTEVPVFFEWWGASNGDKIGAVWEEGNTRYEAIAKDCLPDDED